MEAIKKPKRRFSGYNEVWEQRKISDLCSISTGKSNTQDKVEDGEYPFYVRSPIIERSTKYLYDEEAVLTVGDGVGTGKVFHYVNGKYDLHQRCYRMYDFTDELNAKYFYHVFSKLFYNRVMSMTAKTSVDSVRMEMIADMKIPTPNIKEQEKVEAVFTNLDNLSALHQRKYEKFQSLKKAYLSEMFPLPGEKRPRRRFAGFTGDWEQRKLGDIAEVKDSARIPNNEWTESGVPYIRASDISNDDLSGVLFISKDKYEFYKERTGAPNKNDVLFNGGGEIGKAVLKEDDSPVYVQGGAVLYVRTSESEHLRGDYLVSYFSTKSAEQYIEVASAGGTMKHYTLKPAQNMPVVFPGAEEQEKIGAYFTELDNLIALHQRKLAKLQALKKAYLTEMFP